MGRRGTKSKGAEEVADDSEERPARDIEWTGERPRMFGVWDRLEHATDIAKAALTKPSGNECTLDALIAILPEATAEFERLRFALDRGREIVWRLRAQVVAQVHTAIHMPDDQQTEEKAAELARKVRCQKESVDTERGVLLGRLNTLQGKIEVARKQHEQLLCIQETDISGINNLVPKVVMSLISQEAEMEESMARLDHMVVSNKIGEIKAQLHALQENSMGWTNVLQSLLCKAVDHGWSGLVQFYMQLGLDVKDAMNSIYGHEALCLAAKDCDLGRVRRLIDHGATASDEGFDYLSAPICLGAIDIVRLLLEHNALPDGSGVRDRPPLHCTLTKCQSDIAKLLLEYGAHVDSRDEENKTSLMSTSDCDWCDDFEAQVRMAQVLIEHRADVNASTSDGWNSLHFASRSGNEHLARLLIDASADVDAVTSNATSSFGSTEDEALAPQSGIPCGDLGCSPLTVAVEAGHLSIVALLKARGACMTATVMHTEDGNKMVRALEQQSEAPVEGGAQWHVERQTVCYDLSEDGHLTMTVIPDEVDTSFPHRRPKFAQCILL